MSAFQTYFEQKGDPKSQPLVLIHAFPLHSAMWNPQFEALAKDFHVVRYDVRGFGKSKVDDPQVTIELFVDDLLALLDQLKIKEAVLCGLSMGGYIALRFAERHPERVSGLVLADTKSDADGNEAKIKRAQGVGIIKNRGLESFLKPFVQGAAVNVVAQAEMLKWGMESPPSAVAGALIAMAGRTDTTPALAKFDFPTLVIVGDKDTITPDGEKLRKGIPGAKLVTLSGAGHLSNLDQAEPFTKAVREFAKAI